MDTLSLFKDWSSDRGAELVEFALTFPLLLLVCLGIIDVGLLFQRLEVLTNAAREGARVAVLPNYGDADVTARVTQYLQGTGLDAATVPPPTTQILDPLPNGECVTVKVVTVTYDHQYFFVGGILTYFGSNLGQKTLTGRAAMRQETAAGSCT
jgi:Flp pilus assembly protein TadG